MLYTKESIKLGIKEMALKLANPGDYHLGVGKTPGEPSNILFLRRDPSLPINVGNDFARLCHERHVLTISLQTEGLVCVDGQTFHLPVDYVSLVYPYQLHYYMVNQNQFFWLVVTFEMHGQESMKRLSTASIAMTDFQYMRLFRMLEMYMAIQAGQTAQETLLQRMLGNFLLDMGLTETRVDASDSASSMDSIGEFESANRYIFARLEDPALCIEDIAAHLGISISKLYSLFEMMSGSNPGEYIRTQRIRRAMKMLERTALPIAEIAHRNGFSSPAIFSRSFGNVVGMSPRKYAAKRHLDRQEAAR